MMANVALEIRKVIFEKFNSDERFTNDQVFAELQKGDKIEKSLTIDDMEKYFTELCDAGIMRNIAQNFTTQWFKLFDPLEKTTCQSCGEIPLNKSEEKNCPSCKAAI
jgi:rubrerythrin